MNKPGKQSNRCEPNCKKHTLKIKINTNDKPRGKGETIEISFCPEGAIESPMKTIVPLSNPLK